MAGVTVTPTQLSKSESKIFCHEYQTQTGSTAVKIKLTISTFVISVKMKT